MSTTNPHSVPEALERAVRDLGRRLGENPDRVRAVLSDALGSEARSHRAEIDAVVVATEEGIPATLVDRSEIVATESDVEHGDQRLLARLAERGLNRDAATFALGTWAGALGAATSVTSTPSIEAASAGSLDATGVGGSVDSAGAVATTGAATADSHLDATTMPRDVDGAVAGVAQSPPQQPPDGPGRRHQGVVSLLSRRAVGGAAAAVVLLVAAALWASSLRGTDVDLQLADSGRTSTTTTAPVTTTVPAPTTTTRTAAPTTTRAATTKKPAATKKPATTPQPTRARSTTPAPRSSSTPAPRRSSTPPRSSSTSKKTPPPPPPAPKTLRAGSTSYSYVPYASNNGGPCAADVGTPANWCRSTFPAIKSGTVTSWSVTSAYSANGHGAVTFSGRNVYYDPHHNGAFSDVVYYRLSGGGVTSNWGSFTITMSCNTNYQCF